MALARDDDMIVDADVEPLARVDDLAGDVDILPAGRWVAGRVIMDKDERRRPQVNGAADDFAGIDRRLVDRSVAHMIVADQHVAAVQLQIGLLTELVI